MKDGKGCGYHHYHCKFDEETQMHPSIGLMDEEELDILESAGTANTNSGIAQNLHFVCSGVLFSANHKYSIFLTSRNARGNDLHLSDQMLEYF